MHSVLGREGSLKYKSISIQCVSSNAGKRNPKDGSLQSLYMVKSSR